MWKNGAHKRNTNKKKHQGKSATVEIHFSWFQFSTDNAYEISSFQTIALFYLMLFHIRSVYYFEGISKISSYLKNVLSIIHRWKKNKKSQPMHNSRERFWRSFIFSVQKTTHEDNFWSYSSRSKTFSTPTDSFTIMRATEALWNHVPTAEVGYNFIMAPQKCSQGDEITRSLTDVIWVQAGIKKST